MVGPAQPFTREAGGWAPPHLLDAPHELPWETREVAALLRKRERPFFSPVPPNSKRPPSVLASGRLAEARREPLLAERRVGLARGEQAVHGVLDRVVLELQGDGPGAEVTSLLGSAGVPVRQRLQEGHQVVLLLRRQAKAPQAIHPDDVQLPLRRGPARARDIPRVVEVHDRLEVGEDAVVHVRCGQGDVAERGAPLAAVPVNIRFDVAYGNDLCFCLRMGEAF